MYFCLGSLAWRAVKLKAIICRVDKATLRVISQNPHSKPGMWTLSPILQMRKLRLAELSDFTIEGGALNPEGNQILSASVQIHSH